MDSLTVAAASGMRSRTESLEMLANNIANASSTGFKADREFYSLYSAADSEAASMPGATPPELPVIERRWTDFSQGSLSPTANPLDLALSGKGFFVVRTPSGPLYTRDGGFRLSASGELQTREGYPVLSQKQKPISLDASRATDIGKDGVIRQDGQDVAKLALVEFSDLNALSKQGDSYFRFSASDNLVKPAPGVEVRQGALESANQQPAEAAVRLVNVLRQFEMLQKAMTLGDEMNRQVIQQVASVT